MNRIVASFAGVFKDVVGGRAGAVVAPITDFPDFVHLEADGRPQDDDPEDVADE